MIDLLRSGYMEDQDVLYIDEEEFMQTMEIMIESGMQEELIEYRRKYGKNYSYRYEIVNEYDYTPEQLEDLNYEYQYNIDISAAKSIDILINYINGGKTLDSKFMWITVVKVDNRWYCLDW